MSDALRRTRLYWSSAWTKPISQRVDGMFELACARLYTSSSVGTNGGMASFPCASSANWHPAPVIIR
jgi:hypothetical protein